MSDFIAQTFVLNLYHIQGQNTEPPSSTQVPPKAYTGHGSAESVATDALRRCVSLEDTVLDRQTEKLARPSFAKPLSPIEATSVSIKRPVPSTTNVSGPTCLRYWIRARDQIHIPRQDSTLLLVGFWLRMRFVRYSSVEKAIPH